MNGLLYAVIAYVRSPVGIFVEELRRELHPAHTHADAHLTVLPPRPLTDGHETRAIELVAQTCHTATPFTVTMGDVESFMPVTPTVFIRVAHGGYRMRELHDGLNSDVFSFKEPWLYMPHLTIVKTDTAEQAAKALEIARRRWASYTDNRTVSIHKLTLVKGNGERWVDLTTVRFGQPKP